MLVDLSSTLRKLNPFKKRNNNNNRADLSGEKKYNDVFRSENTLKKFKLNLAYVVVGFALEQRSLVMICA